MSLKTAVSQLVCLSLPISKYNWQQIPIFSVRDHVSAQTSFFCCLASQWVAIPLWKLSNDIFVIWELSGSHIPLHCEAWCRHRSKMEHLDIAEWDSFTHFVFLCGVQLFSFTTSTGEVTCIPWGQWSSQISCWDKRSSVSLHKHWPYGYFPLWEPWGLHRVLCRVPLGLEIWKKVFATKPGVPLPV